MTQKFLSVRKFPFGVVTPLLPFIMCDGNFPFQVKWRAEIW